MTRTLNPEGLSRPEAFTEERFRKRYRAVLRKHGACAFCKFRETTFGIPHCQGNVDRRQGICEHDGKLPKFETAPAAVKEIRDAA